MAELSHYFGLQYGTISPIISGKSHKSLASDLTPHCLRNHTCKSMEELMERVEHFMDTASPFPDNGYGIKLV